MASPSVYHFSRKSEESNDDEDVYTYHITLEQTTSESDVDLSDAETIESVQANTTVSAKDSSDISTDELSDYLMSEYEIASSPESIEKSMFSSSSSPRDIEFVFSCSETENSNVTDVSDYDSDNLVLGDNKFYHTCAQCFSRNENPAFRFCDSCYQLRKESFITKPTRKRKRTEVDHPFKKQKKCTENNASDSGPNEEIVANTVESKSSDQASSVDGSLSQETVKSFDVANNIMDSGFESLSPSAEWDIMEPKEKCLTCLNNSVNGLFLHGRTAHKCCCYQCSKRIWSKSGRCPICRRKIHNVVLLLNC